MPTTATATTTLYDNIFGNQGTDYILNNGLQPDTGSIHIHATKAMFTDGGGASGTYAYDVSKFIPLGAYATITKLKVNIAATGDTTAVLLVGDGSDADRYNVATTSIFTAGFVDMTTLGIPSGTKFHSAAKNITLTVTGGSDFGLLAAFDIDLSIAFSTP